MSEPDFPNFQKTFDLVDKDTERSRDWMLKVDKLLNYSGRNEFKPLGKTLHDMCKRKALSLKSFERVNGCVDKGDPFNIIYFNFKKAFNKVSIHVLKEAKKVWDMRGGAYMDTTLIKDRKQSRKNTQLSQRVWNST